jgi:hypothetical protein
VIDVPSDITDGTRAPRFSDVDDHAGLVAWSRAYAAHVLDVTDLAVSLDGVEWEVSTRAKRRAAAVLHPRIDGASLGDPLDWATCPAAEDGPPAATVRLTWAAATAYDRTEWARTLRHELVHVEQFQRFGATGHDDGFRERAAALDTSVRCPHFATPKYLLTCSTCEDVVARRFRDCKLVRRHEEYRSGCCRAPLALRRTGASAD